MNSLQVVSVINKFALSHENTCHPEDVFVFTPEEEKDITVLVEESHRQRNNLNSTMFTQLQVVDQQPGERKQESLDDFINIFDIKRQVCNDLHIKMYEERRRITRELVDKSLERVRPHLQSHCATVLKKRYPSEMENYQDHLDLVANIFLTAHDQAINRVAELSGAKINGPLPVNI